MTIHRYRYQSCVTLGETIIFGIHITMSIIQIVGVLYQTNITSPLG